MTTTLPSWVTEFEEEYNRFKYRNKKYWIIGLVLLCIFFVTVTLPEVKNNELLRWLNFTILCIGTLLFAMYFNKNPSYVSKYLASMIYLIGFNLEKNSDTDSKIYLNNMENYLKKCDAIIADVHSSLFGALYINGTREYVNKLTRTIKLLNEYYANYKKYDLNKSEIATTITKLADLIHNDKGYVTSEHFDLINSLTDDLTSQDVNEKTLHISKIERITSVSKAFILGLPNIIKLIIYVVLVFFITYELINYMAISKGIAENIAFGYAIVGGIGALVPALMIKESIIK